MFENQKYKLKIVINKHPDEFPHFDNLKKLIDIIPNFIGDSTLGVDGEDSYIILENHHRIYITVYEKYSVLIKTASGHVFSHESIELQEVKSLLKILKETYITVKHDKENDFYRFDVNNKTLMEKHSLDYYSPFDEYYNHQQYLKFLRTNIRNFGLQSKTKFEDYKK